MRRISILLLTLPLLLLSACSDDDTGDTTTLSPPSATATAQPATDPMATATSSSQAAPTAAAVEGAVRVDFTGAPDEREPIDASFEVEEGSTAWDAILAALGEDNVSYNDFGGDLGIFVTGFNGIEAEGNHFWEFRVNGESATSGVGKYEVQDGDVIEFVYSSF